MLQCSKLCGRISASDKAKWPLEKKKKRQQTTTLAAAEATVYERKINAGDAF